MADLAFRVQHVIKTEIDVTQAQLSRNNIELLIGIAQFVDPNTIRVDGVRGAADLYGRRIMIATGTKPARSPKVPIERAISSTATRFCRCPRFRKR